MSLQLETISHSLVELSPNEWKILLDLYSTKRTESTGYNLISNFIKWIARNPKLNIKCFALDDGWKKDGTFIMIVDHGGVQKNVYFNTITENLDHLIKLLFSYTTDAKPYLLYGYGERLKPAVDAYIKKYDQERMETAQTAWYRATKEIVATFSIEPPADITLRKLEIGDAETVNEIWPHRAEGSVEFVKLLIENNVSVGACDKNGTLIAWCLRLPLGSLGLLQVVATHKRLGLGSLMVRYLSKKIAELGEEVLSPVVTENTPSRRMFEKLGFEKIDNVYWTVPIV
ncbi:uncharacterized protein LOC117564728 [Drosophila albomicans]|uniref:Uncharacterized protein LOC117564728 n=1 Tax=Drosophila albomicans TaxID=7291 RepID=A0A6P8WNH5_DROAB|nr:uncharacterized protein LOC117564728 [Drosophila albomicans]